MSDHIIQISNLTTAFKTQQGEVRAVDDISLVIPRGKITALVGESGCGKSVTAMSLLRLIQKPGEILGGKILLESQGEAEVDILKLPEDRMREIRGNKIAMIFQEPMTSLNPVFTVGDQIMEAVILHQRLSRSNARQKAIEMLKRVGISNPESRVDGYPHEMSGGMRQRVMIAMALSCHPDLLIADEPTTALDVTIQAQILELIQGLVRDTGMSVLLITHDLGIVASYAQSVAVMYAGEIIEAAPTRDLFREPRHPYTRGLLASIPSLKPKGEKHLRAIPGVVPSLADLPAGCRFQERCEKVAAGCRAARIGWAQEGERGWRCVDPHKGGNI